MNGPMGPMGARFEGAQRFAHFTFILTGARLGTLARQYSQAEG